jgi:hypothetical protein
MATLLRQDTRGTAFDDVKVCPDLTKRQRQEETGLQDKAVKRNMNPSEDDRTKNLVWTVVGRRGEKRLVKRFAERSRATESNARAGANRQQNQPQHTGSGTRERRSGEPDLEGTGQMGGGESRRDGDRGERGAGSRNQGTHQQQEEVRGGGGHGSDANGKTLVIMYTNAQSLAGKVYELSCVVLDMDPDLILISETWCNRDITDSFLTIPGYEVQTDLRTDRTNTGGGRGGGFWYT